LSIARWSLFASLVAVFLAGPVAAEDTPAPDRRSVEEIVKAVVSADGPSHAAEQYKALFAAAGAKGLGDLRLSLHESIAIQAAWQEVNLTLPERFDDGNAVVF